MTILITGASGLLGRSLMEICERNSLKYVGTYNTRKIKNGININFNSEDEIKKQIIDNQITVCINCIVQRQVDICENNWEETKRVNVDLVTTLSRVCNELNVYLIHISTDYVFDGKKSPYYPENKTNPLQNYGISKLISEHRVINNLTNYTIIRVPVLYSDNIENLSENAVTIIGKKVLNQIEETSEDDYSVRRPVYIPDFCKFIISFISNPKYGTYHYYNYLDRTTKYKTALLIGKYLSKSTTHIKPLIQFSNMANRPYDTELRDNTYDITQYNTVNLEEGLARCFKRWKHPKITEKGSNVFVMIDLDGTILDTDGIHYDSYKKALSEYGIELSRKVFDELINISSMDIFLRDNNILNEIKPVKKRYMLEQKDIKFMPGAESFINKLIMNDINFVVVTNTSNGVINHYMECLPILKKVKNWICREDYNNPKPDRECYKLAKDKYYKGEECTIGFENTINGYSAIETEVDCVYFITTKDSFNYNKIKKEDIYLISTFDGL